MNKGTILCDCGQEFYYETIRDHITCIHCGKRYDLKKLQDKDEEKAGD